MDFNVCAQCGSEIAGSGIHFRKRNFCSDECCEAFDDKYLARGEPDLEELAEPEDFEDEDLDFEEDDLDEDLDDDLDGDLDDDFAISPDDY